MLTPNLEFRELHHLTRVSVFNVMWITAISVILKINAPFVMISVECPIDPILPRIPASNAIFLTVWSAHPKISASLAKQLLLRDNPLPRKPPATFQSVFSAPSKDAIIAKK